jgi:S-DNA-T family DNA segregation ATPase FtsK/SpoIIIE
MKPTRIVLEPTRSRPVNIFLGLLLLLVSALLFLALATWHAADPSFNTSADPAATHAARNWIGLFGAVISDLMLQILGITSFFIPMWIGGLGWTWMRSRSGGSPILRWIGTCFALTFIPTVFALLPWHWHWMHLVPVEGVVGKLMAGMLVGYLNIQGAWVVAGVLAAIGLYFASAISFWALKESIEERWIHVVSWYERWRNWREERAESRAEREHEEAEAEPELEFAPEPAEQTASHKGGFFAALFRRRRETEVDPIDEIPAFKRAAMHRNEGEETASAPRRASIWERAEEQEEPAAVA